MLQVFEHKTGLISQDKFLNTAIVLRVSQSYVPVNIKSNQSVLFLEIILTKFHLHTPKIVLKYLLMNNMNGTLI